MKLLRDFFCDHCNMEQERYVDSETKAVSCNCGHDARRVIGMPRVALDGTDPSFPTAYDKWASIREENRVVKGRRSYQRQ